MARFQAFRSSPRAPDSSARSPISVHNFPNSKEMIEEAFLPMRLLEIEP